MGRVVIGRFRNRPRPTRISDAAYLLVLDRIIEETGGYPSPLYFVQVESRDPSPSILIALQEEYGEDHIKPASEMPDKPGCCGTLVYAEEAQEGPSGSVTMAAGYDCGMLCARRSIYTLRTKDGAYRVVGDRMLWIS